MLIVYFRKHTYSLLELHISITESEHTCHVQNLHNYKYSKMYVHIAHTTYKVAKEKQMEKN